MQRVRWGVTSIRSSEQVQVSVLVILLAISYFTVKIFVFRPGPTVVMVGGEVD